MLEARGQLAHARGAGRSEKPREGFPITPATPSLILFLKYKIILPLISLVVRAGYGPITHGGDLVQQVLVGPSLIPG